MFGDNLSAAAVRMMACDAAIIPIVLGSNSEPLDVGMEQRLVNRAMRRALIKRDKGCLVCKAPPPMCHAHHIVHWVDGGPTALNNLALFCACHHHEIHKGHYTVTIANGKVHVTRPTWADPTPVPMPRRIRLTAPASDSATAIAAWYGTTRTQTRSPASAATSASSSARPPTSAAASDTAPAPESAPARGTGSPSTAPASAARPARGTGAAYWSETTRMPGSTPAPAATPMRSTIPWSPETLAPQPMRIGQSVSTADRTGILSWLTPEAVARLNPWGENDNADPGP
jgi:hypothetical protein